MGVTWRYDLYYSLSPLVNYYKNIPLTITNTQAFQGVGTGAITVSAQQILNNELSIFVIQNDNYKSWAG